MNTTAAVDLRDPETFREFYASSLPRVYGFLLRRCGDRTVAEDLAQDTFLTAVTAIRNGRRIDEPTAWVIGVARHKLLDHYRRVCRERAGLAGILREVRTQHDDPQPTGDPALDALVRLPADQRAAVVLHHIEGISVADVATTLARSVHATESLLARARAGLRSHLVEAADA